MDKKEIATDLGIFIGGLTIGTVVGMKLSKKKYEKVANEEIESVKEKYKLLHKDDYATPAERMAAIQHTQDVGESAVLALIDTRQHIIDPDSGDVINTPATFDDTVVAQHPAHKAEIVNYGGSLDDVIEEKNLESSEDQSTPHNKVDRSIFDSDAGTDPADVVMPDPDPENPYIITVDEYMDDDSIYSKVSIVYWEADDTLAAEDDTIIPNVGTLVGEANLKKFGHGSKDRNIVYVRNQKLETDFEITRDPRSFIEVVLDSQQ